MLLSNWNAVSEVATLFPDLETAANAEGEEINGNWMSRVVRVSGPEAAYYVKTYTSRGMGLRRFAGRSRVRAEWENLQYFAALSLPVAEVVAYGEANNAGAYQGVVVTREVRGTRDLAALALESSHLFRHKKWRAGVIGRLSDAVRALHLDGFVHNDLKWRNILVETCGDDPAIYLIDCPMGRKLFGPLLTRGRIKDLACLDRFGATTLSRTDRLRFYLSYKGEPGLTVKNKMEIRRVLAFFEGRD